MLYDFILEYTIHGNNKVAVKVNSPDNKVYHTVNKME